MTARIMKAWGLCVLLVAMVILAGGCGTEAQPAEGPESTVRRFYDRYLGGTEGGSAPGNILLNGAYRESEDLAPEFVAEIDALLASFEAGGYDPFICAQDIPTMFAQEPPRIEGESATILVNTSFEGHSFTVELEQSEGAWLITGVVCGE